MDVILFLIFATIAVVCAINVVVQTHPISSALSLVGVMGSLAVLYLLLGAEFIAAAQVIVYAGAIMVLFIFVIMLLNAGAEVKKGQSTMALFLGVPLLAGLLIVMCWYLQSWFPIGTTVHFGGFQSTAPHTGPLAQSGGSAHEVGIALFTRYLLPFEVTSVLILIAILGAIVLARKEID
ncbi:MAG TPA: NADH-quinone oxidoreductase subunit J [Bryobacteraceae bacterium]|nr:NADH-quinone oxidoreductase subunit J [Bryobacteraceae bacterium]